MFYLTGAVGCCCCCCCNAESNYVLQRKEIILHAGCSHVLMNNLPRGDNNRRGDVIRGKTRTWKKSLTLIHKRIVFTSSKYLDFSHGFIHRLPFPVYLSHLFLLRVYRVKAEIYTLRGRRRLGVQQSPYTVREVKTMKNAVPIIPEVS